MFADVHRASLKEKPFIYCLCQQSLLRIKNSVFFGRVVFPLKIFVLFRLKYSADTYFLSLRLLTGVRSLRPLLPCSTLFSHVHLQYIHSYKYA